MKRVFILHYHEIWLKGGNKNFFLSRLRANLKQVLSDIAIEPIEFIADRLVLVPPTDEIVPEILERLRRVFGLAYIAVAREVPSDLASLSAAAQEMTEEKHPRSFAVRAKVAGSDFDLSPSELEREVGRVILEHLRTGNPEVRVDLDHPDVTCRIEIVSGRAFIYVDRVEGAGGLPAATAGRLVVLLSGGFDSAVAAYKMMRRGAHVTFVHFFGSPSPARSSSRPVADSIARILTSYQLSSRLYLVPFDSIQREIVAGAPEAPRILLYRRMMARIAGEIARVERALGLVTGDSVSQVASQTLRNIAALDEGVGLTIYRPLAGDDKAEILRLARQIGTYRPSCEPFEDCCPRFLPRSPVLFAKPGDLRHLEAALDVDRLVTRALEGASATEYKYEGGQIIEREGLPVRFQRLVARRKMDAETGLSQVQPLHPS